MGTSDEPAPRRLRIEVRLSPEQDALIREATDLEGTTASAFVRSTAALRAQEIIRGQNDMVLSAEAFDALMIELDKPAEIIPELVELFRRHPPLPTDRGPRP